MKTIWLNIADWLEKLQLPCIHKFVTGDNCPGCGMQRSIIALMRGNVIESIKMYPALIPITIMIILLIVHVKFKLKHGAKILIYLFIFNAIIILCNFLYKLLI